MTFCNLLRSDSEKVQECWTYAISQAGSLFFCSWVRLPVGCAAVLVFVLTAAVGNPGEGDAGKENEVDREGQRVESWYAPRLCHHHLDRFSRRLGKTDAMASERGCEARWWHPPGCAVAPETGKMPVLIGGGCLTRACLLLPPHVCNPRVAQPRPTGLDCGTPGHPHARRPAGLVGVHQNSPRARLT